MIVYVNVGCISWDMWESFFVYDLRYYVVKLYIFGILLLFIVSYYFNFNEILEF